MPTDVEIVPMNMGHYDQVLELWNRTAGVMLVDTDTPERAPAYFQRNPGLSHVALSNSNHESTSSMNNKPISVGRFFDTLTGDYTETIERCFPRYREMLWAVLDYLPEAKPFDTVLELGTGTGNLTVLLAEKFPDAALTAVDLSGDSLDVCRERLAGRDSIEYQQEDFRNLSFRGELFDLIVSSISVHHLTAVEKQALFANIYQWLKPGGIFAYVDQHAGATSDLYQRHIDNWKQISMAAGSTAEEWEMWMQHQREHDHHDKLSDQMQWLSEAGFSAVDCPWRYLLWTVLQARKEVA